MWPSQSIIMASSTEPYHTPGEQLNRRFGLNSLSRTIVGMKRALAALLGVLVVLGAALYLFVVRPLLRPSDMTAVAESALATEDLLLLGGINVKQAVFLERWFLGTPRALDGASGGRRPPRWRTDRSSSTCARRAWMRGTMWTTRSMRSTPPPPRPPGTRSCCVGRFNPTAINAYLTRELHATPRAGAGPHPTRSSGRIPPPAGRGRPGS